MLPGPFAGSKQKSNKGVVATKPAVRAVRRRQHTIARGDAPISPLLRRPQVAAMPSQNLTIFQMLQQFNKFESQSAFVIKFAKTSIQLVLIILHAIFCTMLSHSWCIVSLLGIAAINLHSLTSDGLVSLYGQDYEHV